FFFQAEDGIRYRNVTGVQTCALPIYYDTISDSLSRLAKLRHDFKNYLAIFQQYLINGDQASASSFISEISEKTVNPLQVIITGKIGRASCRERVKVSCSADEVKYNTQ